MNVPKDKFILDACCGPKQMWINKQHPNTLYIDIRREKKGFSKHEPNMSVEPDFIMDFRKMDFPDNSFKLVVCDPPHMKTLGETSMFRQKYGCLNAETWPIDLKMAFKEMWRVLQDYGVLILKWNNTEIPFKKVIKLFPDEPLFQNISVSRGKCKTAWFCFMKIPNELKKLKQV